MQSMWKINKTKGQRRKETTVAGEWYQLSLEIKGFSKDTRDGRSGGLWRRLGLCQGHCHATGTNTRAVDWQLIGRRYSGGGATHSSILAWRILWTEEPGGLLSMWLHRVGRDWSDLAAAAAVGRQRKKWMSGWGGVSLMIRRNMSYKAGYTGR